MRNQTSAQKIRCARRQGSADEPVNWAWGNDVAGVNWSMPAELPSYFFPLLWAGMVMLVVGVLGVATPRCRDADGECRWRMALLSLVAAICVGAALCLVLILGVR
jgi:hypothetical protein